MSLAVIITAAILIGQTSQAGTCKLEFTAGKYLFQMPGSPEFYYCPKDLNGVFVSSRVSSVDKLKSLTSNGYFLNIEKSTAINNSIKYYQLTLDPYGTAYKTFLVSPVSWVLSNGLSANALVVSSGLGDGDGCYIGGDGKCTGTEPCPDGTTRSCANYSGVCEVRCSATTSINTDLNNRISVLESLVNDLKRVIEQLTIALGLSSNTSLSNTNSLSTNISLGGKACATTLPDGFGACAAGATCTDSQGESGACITSGNDCFCLVENLLSGLSPYINRAILVTDNGELNLIVAGTISTNIILIRNVSTLSAIAYTYPLFAVADTDGDGFTNGEEIANHYNFLNATPFAGLQSLSDIAGAPFTVGMTRTNYISKTSN
ncbi:MAG: thrombospondin type 3 repeat-containing protein [bacterium]